VVNRILQAGEIEQLAPDPIARLRMPEGEHVFAERAARLRQLAGTSAIGGYLQFLAQLADCQRIMCAALECTPIPDPPRLAHCRQHAMPPLAASHWHRDPKWCWALRSTLLDLKMAAAGPAAAAIVRLLDLGDDFFEAQASKICAGTARGLDLALAPLLAAALQAYWTSMAGRIAAGDVGAGAAPGLCPVCGSPPVSSVVRIGGADSGCRYLHCSLCSSQWQMVRIKCSRCESTKGIRYYGIDGGSPAVKAEACGECGTYLKILYMEQDPAVDPAADDLASLALDLLLTEENIACSGANLLLFHAAA